jgi:hypothetical protein
MINDLITKVCSVTSIAQAENMVDYVNDAILSYSKEEVRNGIQAFLTFMDDGIEGGTLEPVEWETKHQFTLDAYCREFYVPAGTMIIGKIHHHEHFLFAMAGDILVFSEDGAELVRAPRVMISRVGIQRVGLSLTDTKWAAVFPTIERDIDVLENTLFSMNYDEYLTKENIHNVLPSQAT